MIPIQGSEAWIKFRRDKITATDIPVLMRENPYKTVLQLCYEKKGIVQTHETEAMTEGKRLEPIIREMYEKISGHVILPVPKPVISVENDRFMASLDGISFCGTFGCELKSANTRTHRIAETGIVPQIYYGQVQWQMYCTGLNFWDYVSYGKLCKTLIIVPVLRDNDYIKLAKFQAEVFLEYMNENRTLEEYQEIFI